MKSSTTLKDQLPSRFRGTIQGAAIGSALGFPYSGSSRTFMRALGSEVLQGYVRHRNGYYPVGQHGAGVQMLSLAADAISHAGAVDPVQIVDHWIPLWRENRIIERLPDVDVAMSRWLRRGTEARGCACGPGENGSGSLVSSILIGLWDHDSPDALVDDCERLIGVTHEDTEVRAVCAALASIIGHNLTHHDVVLGDVIDGATAAAARIDTSVPRRIQEIPMLLAASEAEAFEKLAGSEEEISDVEHSGVENRALPIFLVALHSWLRSPSDPLEVMGSCLHSGGAVEMTAAVGGALVGSCVGEECFPARLIEGLLERDEITSSADRLYQRQVQERRRRNG